jgi:hypothetical protein
MATRIAEALKTYLRANAVLSGYAGGSTHIVTDPDASKALPVIEVLDDGGPEGLGACEIALIRFRCVALTMETVEKMHGKLRSMFHRKTVYYIGTIYCVESARVGRPELLRMDTTSPWEGSAHYNFQIVSKDLLGA